MREIIFKKKLWMGFNAVGFNIAWWACVLGVSWGVPYLGPGIMGIFLTIHIKKLALGAAELRFLFLTGLIGTIVDGIKYGSGFISYSGGYPGIDFLAPMWITAMWVGFAALLNHSLKWLKGRLVPAIAMGAIFGPLAYLTGVKTGVLEFNLPRIPSFLILGAVWGIAIPLLYWISDKLGVRSEDKDDYKMIDKIQIIQEKA